MSAKEKIKEEPTVKQSLTEHLEKEISRLNKEIKSCSKYLDNLFKLGEYITDGSVVIRIGGISEADWTPHNNYGNKWHEYTNCNYFISDKQDHVWPIFSVNSRLETKGGRITAMWFQGGYQLENFRRINKKLLSPEILKQLE